ncbi:MAG TPA: right-handed parallel beta-helix repeat-containing protein, partial [Thermoanaerobaculia bacterium]|nr:right-handed parallel beta-helix repeat-containing protein [Thermoanaerobaculia bacterium]
MRSTFALFALLFSLAASAQTLHVTIFPPRAVGDDLQGEWLVRISNAGGEITDARLSFTAHGAQVVGMAPPLVCAEDGCFLPSIPAAGRLDVRVRLHSNFRYGQITSVASVTRPGGERVDAVSYHTLWKDYMVTSTADSGPGTLRQAILDINAQCAATPCRAAFDIEQKIGGDFFHTVELHSPLPALNVPRSSVDGSTEDQSNTLGPSVALDGAMLHAGNGITVERGICDVKGIAIGNFPWNGIYASAQARVNVDSTYIGVNALGMVPKPNRSRGIASENVSGTITRSLIAYNGRSGIFFTGPINRGVEIIGNRIIENGASGIYVGGNERMYQFTFIRDNIITGNAHFGVAIDPRALVIVQPNSIHGNGGGGIDIGLDGP